MDKRILIAGLGMGSFYKTLLNKMGYQDVWTLDTDIKKNADYNDIKQIDGLWDLAIVATPTHFHLDTYLRLKSKIFLIEKPGFARSQTWEYHYKKNANLFMTKNNMYRTSFTAIRHKIINEIADIKRVNILWLSKNRVPSPGSWFTRKSCEGGVTKDLMPHLIHEYFMLFDKEIGDIKEIFKEQVHYLSDFRNTDYGNVDNHGTYDVEDHSTIIFENIVKGKKIEVALEANWKTDFPDKIGIEIVYEGATSCFFEMGLCPDECYKRMFSEFLEEEEELNKEYHYKIDIETHNLIDIIII